MKKLHASLISVAVGVSVLLSGCAATAKKNTAVPQVNVTLKNIQLAKASNSSANPQTALNRKDTIVAGISAPGGVFLPYFYTNGWDDNATSPIFARLFEFDSSGTLIPSLAEKYTVSSDQLTYTITLRKNLKFSDGSPLTAEDVAFTLTLLHDPAYSGNTDITIAAVKGGKDYQKGSATSVSGIKVVDAQTIQVTTDKVNAQTLSLINVRVFSKAYYGKSYQKGQLAYLKDLYSKPLGAGPYKFSSYVPGQEVRYVANSNYYAGKPKIENFVYKVTPEATKLQLLQTGDTDYDRLSATPEVISSLKGLGFLDVRSATANSYGYAEFNLKKPYLKDPKVRQALIIGLDRQKYIDARYRGLGKVANVPSSPFLWSYTEAGVDKMSFDTGKAKQLLDEAGWKVGADGYREKDGQKLKITYLTRWATDEIIPIAQENYKALGVQFVPQVMDVNSITSQVKQGNYDLASFYTSQQLDPNDGVKFFKSNDPSNLTGYSNEKVDELITAGTATLDQSKRKATYEQLYQTLTTDPPVILLYYSTNVWAYNSRIQNFNISDFTGIEPSYDTWSIK
jgi:peptide/nickel transport system substrate-binding protein